MSTPDTHISIFAAQLGIVKWSGQVFDLCGICAVLVAQGYDDMFGSSSGSCNATRPAFLGCAAVLRFDESYSCARCGGGFVSGIMGQMALK